MEGWGTGEAEAGFPSPGPHCTGVNDSPLPFSLLTNCGHAPCSSPNSVGLALLWEGQTPTRWR